MMKITGMKRILSLALVLCMLLAVSNLETFAATTSDEPARVVLTVKQVGSSSVKVSWKQVSEADGYEIYRKDGATGTFKKIADINGAKILSHKDMELILGKTYTYKVRAFKLVENNPVKGKFSLEKKLKLTNMKPKFTVTLPDSIDKKNKKIVITLTNDSKSDSTYFNGFFALEDDSGKIYNLKSVSYEKPDNNQKGSLSKGSNLILKAGKTVRFTCKFDSLSSKFKYDKNLVRLTTCVRYKKKDFVSVYSTRIEAGDDTGEGVENPAGEGTENQAGQEEKRVNDIFTTEEYYEYLTGGQ